MAVIINTTWLANTRFFYLSWHLIGWWKVSRFFSSFPVFPVFFCLPCRVFFPPWIFLFFTRNRRGEGGGGVQVFPLDPPLSSTLRYESFSSSCEWLTVSTALARSRNTAPVRQPLSMEWRIWSGNLEAVVTLDEFSLKPNWLGEIKLFSVK